MTYNELVQKILEICPNALFSDTDGGEIEILTGWVCRVPDDESELIPADEGKTD
jgi:hypothetical protein